VVCSCGTGEADRLMGCWESNLLGTAAEGCGEMGGDLPRAGVGLDGLSHCSGLCTSLPSVSSIISIMGTVLAGLEVVPLGMPMRASSIETSEILRG